MRHSRRDAPRPDSTGTSPTSTAQERLARTGVSSQSGLTGRRRVQTPRHADPCHTHHAPFELHRAPRVTPLSAQTASLFLASLENGKLAEHWDVVEDEATRAQSKSGNPMFGKTFPD